MSVPFHLARHRMPIAIVVVFSVPVIAGCGSSSTLKGFPSQLVKSVSTGESAGLEFSRCMRSHGVPNFPDPTTSGAFQAQISGYHTRVVLGDIPGVNPVSPAFKAAQSACQKLLPGAFPKSGPPSATAMAQARACAECMRAHGVPNFPDPTTTMPSHGPPFNGLVNQINGAVFALPAATINTQSPAFKQAATICKLPS
jgi:hypothetical protein